MSKYEPLWNYVKNRGEESCTLTFAEVKDVLGFNLDHSFLTYKKELNEYGYEVAKISMKDKTVRFQKI